MDDKTKTTCFVCGGPVAFIEALGAPLCSNKCLDTLEKARAADAQTYKPIGGQAKTKTACFVCGNEHPDDCVGGTPVCSGRCRQGYEFITNNAHLVHVPLPQDAQVFGRSAGNPEVSRNDHPLAIAFHLAIEQATKGKGERHGGDSIPFYNQQWVTLGRCHGVGFLTGQAAKKLNETAQKTNSDDWEREVLGALVYAGMAVLLRRGLP